MPELPYWLPNLAWSLLPAVLLSPFWVWACLRWADQDGKQ